MTKEKEHLGGDDAHGGRSDLGPAAPPQLSHAEVKYVATRWGRDIGKEWFISRAHKKYGHEYLHDDGVWRSCATLVKGGKEIMSGWYASKEEAEAALATSEGR